MFKPRHSFPDTVYFIFVLLVSTCFCTTVCCHTYWNHADHSRLLLFIPCCFLFCFKTSEKQESWLHANTKKKQYCLEGQGLQSSKLHLHSYLFTWLCFCKHDRFLSHVLLNLFEAARNIFTLGGNFIDCDVLWFWHHYAFPHLTLYICAVARIHYSISTNENETFILHHEEKMEWKCNVFVWQTQTASW